MMKTHLLLAVLLGMFATSFCAMAMGYFNDPNHPGKCAIRSDLILSPGEHKDPNMPCGRILCGDNGMATFHTCGLMMPPPGCTFGDYINASLDYPDCCEKKVIC